MLKSKDIVFPKWPSESSDPPPRANRSFDRSSVGKAAQEGVKNVLFHEGS